MKFFTVKKKKKCPSNFNTMHYNVIFIFYIYNASNLCPKYIIPNNFFFFFILFIITFTFIILSSINMNENKLSIALFSSAIILISSISLYYKFKNDELESKYNDLEKKYEKEKALRHEERSSRIALQQRSREDLLKASKSFGFNYIPIGYIESPFKDRRGTPRQPRLVPGSKGRIRLDKRAVQYEHFAELSSFSHIWILFVFHQNTNLDKSITKKTQNNEETDLAQEIEKDKQQEVDNENPLNYFKKVPAKIKPPRLHGKKVGCLTTRSPHRPNNIGLSVCEVVSVGQDYIEVKGIDMVDGTPVIDGKLNLLYKSSLYNYP